LKRISQIETSEEFAVELARETLRDRRWKRRRNMLLVALACLMVIAGLLLNSHPGYGELSKVLLSLKSL